MVRSLSENKERLHYVKPVIKVAPVAAEGVLQGSLTRMGINDVKTEGAQLSKQNCLWSDFEEHSDEEGENCGSLSLD